ncbi:MAG: hypothetical protein BGO82_17265 [Devosia sp. 67-54]|mgnify:CR=1|uniref:hypothetical protein n=1 Tax=unclassified Devosia TaxID=196773 RepID=UPI00095CD064|nr:MULTISPECIES: hypothetical protein [unclassified Devosia]MBN9304126.1 hypothetical protein [Devosia sp.]OJX17958.1 MAG: hypothetical protein BGO82_17265 [Devosia sp. 67-54]
MEFFAELLKTMLTAFFGVLNLPTLAALWAVSIPVSLLCLHWHAVDVGRIARSAPPRFRDLPGALVIVFLTGPLLATVLLLSIVWRGPDAY